MRSQDCPPAPACIKPTQRRLLHILILILTSSARKEAIGAHTGIHHIMLSFLEGIHAFLFDFTPRQSRSTHIASYKWETIQEGTTNNSQRRSLNATVWEGSAGTIHWTLAQILRVCNDGECTLSPHQAGITSGRKAHLAVWDPKSPLGSLLYQKSSAWPGQATNIHLAQQDLSVLLSPSHPILCGGTSFGTVLIQGYLGYNADTSLLF